MHVNSLQCLTDLEMRYLSCDCVVAHLVKEFLCLYGITEIITTLTRARHWTPVVKFVVLLIFKAGI